MRYEPKRIHLPALGMATALALAVTFGVPLAMEQEGATEAWQDRYAAARHAPATEVAIEPGTIQVTAVRDRTTGKPWLSFLTQGRAG
jgi:hypothetical protein